MSLTPVFRFLVLVSNLLSACSVKDVSEKMQASHERKPEGNPNAESSESMIYQSDCQLPAKYLDVASQLKLKCMSGDKWAERAAFPGLNFEQSIELEQGTPPIDVKNMPWMQAFSEVDLREGSVSCAPRNFDRRVLLESSFSSTLVIRSNLVARINPDAPLGALQGLYLQKLDSGKLIKLPATDEGGWGARVSLRYFFERQPGGACAQEATPANCRTALLMDGSMQPTQEEKNEFRKKVQDLPQVGVAISYNSQDDLYPVGQYRMMAVLNLENGTHQTYRSKEFEVALPQQSSSTQAALCFTED